MQRALMFISLLLAAAFFQGCAAASVGADVVGSTFDVAKEAVFAGKAETFVDVPWERATEATKTVADKLAITFVKETPYADRRKLLYTDDRKQDITITIVRRSANMTELRVDVGLFGPDDEARLTLRELLKELEVAPEDRPKS
jgi:hypothetical protein